MHDAPLSCRQLAERWGYSARTLREYSIAGKIPPPIDPTLPRRMWRWSMASILQYEAGGWRGQKLRKLEVAAS